MLTRQKEKGNTAKVRKTENTWSAKVNSKKEKEKKRKKKEKKRSK
jgi:hypothetical protein